MASNKPNTKALEDLSKNEAEIFLEKLKFKKIRDLLQSQECGIVTGEMLIDLDDTSLTEIGLSSAFQRKQFLKAIHKYKEKGIPHELFTIDETERKKMEIAQCTNERKSLQQLLKKSKKISTASTSEMDIYALSAKKIQVKDLKKPMYGTNLKKVIVMGETGTGKSTFINAFINYALGVEMEDPFRFKLVVDEDDTGNDQTVSQTSEISGYSIKNTPLDFPILIWDTPGFGDTRGIERDEEIKQQINELLKLEDFCHAVCFVVKASANRLTETQKYIIDRVLLFFGKEAQENIYVLVTYADGNRPDVLHALEKYNNFPFDEDRWFAFNNGNLFRPASQRTSFSKVHWEMTNDNLDRLFNKIGGVCPFSLSNTKEVITQREDLARNLEAIAIQVCATAHNRGKWEENLVLLESQLKTVNSMGVFKEIRPQTRASKPATRAQNTICKRCYSNCHIGCGIKEVPFCSKIRKLSLMCKICNCGVFYHHRVFHKYEVSHETSEVNHETQDIPKVQEKYQQAKVESEKKRNEELAKLIELVETVRDQITNINQMAIINYSFSIGEYFKTLCQREEELNNCIKANIYRQLSEENILKTLMNNSKDAPSRVVNELISSEKVK